MTEFLAAVRTQPFLQYALLTGLLGSIACGIVGSYIVSRKITYIAGGIAHSVLAGIGLARYCQIVYDWTWFEPLLGALAAAFLSAMIIGLVSLKAREREDTAISAVWATGMAIGILSISQTPGYGEDLMSYLFGSILMVSPKDLCILAGFDGFVILISLLFHHQLVAVCFDQEFARLRGINVEFFYLLLLCLAAVTIVILVTIVGIVLVIALLALPPAIAGLFFYRLWQIMVAAGILATLFTVAGLGFSYTPDLPPGGMTILIAGLAYFVSIIAAIIRRQRKRQVS